MKRILAALKPIKAFYKKNFMFMSLTLIVSFIISSVFVSNYINNYYNYLHEYGHSFAKVIVGIQNKVNNTNPLLFYWRYDNNNRPTSTNAYSLVNFSSLNIINNSSQIGIPSNLFISFAGGGFVILLSWLLYILIYHNLLNLKDKPLNISLLIIPFIVTIQEILRSFIFADTDGLKIPLNDNSLRILVYFIPKILLFLSVFSFLTILIIRLFKVKRFIK